MFGSIKIMAILLPILLATGSGMWYYVKSLKSELQLAEQQQQVLTEAIDSKNREVERMKVEMIEISEANDRFRKESEKSRQEVNALRDKLSKHDIGMLAEKKPALVQKIINKAIKDVGKDINEITQ